MSSSKLSLKTDTCLSSEQEYPSARS